jgi:hypothetical protein
VCEGEIAGADAVAGSGEFLVKFGGTDGGVSFAAFETAARHRAIVESVTRMREFMAGCHWWFVGFI